LEITHQLNQLDDTFSWYPHFHPVYFLEEVDDFTEIIGEDESSASASYRFRPFTQTLLDWRFLHFSFGGFLHIFPFL